MAEEYALWSGKYYNYSCILKTLIEAVPDLSSIQVSFAAAFQALPNLAISADDPAVTAFLSSTYDVTIPKNEYNSKNLLPLRQIDRGAFKELANMVNPLGAPSPVKQGEINIKAFVTQCSGAVYVIEPEVTSLVDFLIKNLLEQLPGTPVPDDLISTVKKCPYLEGGVDDYLTEDVLVEDAIGTVSSENVTRSYYSGDNMTRRRPPGEFFLVDMIAPPAEGGGPVPMDLVAPDGTPVNCLQLNMLPSSLVVNGAKKINRSQAMTRWIEEHWGDELDQISFSGSTFAFINFNGEGLCVSSRDMTEPYRELQHFVNIYKLNGCVYQGSSLTAKESPRTFFNYNDPASPFRIASHPRVGLIKTRLHIRIRCDFLESVGYFESFDVVESANTPHSLNYSVSFKSEHTTWR